MIFVIDNGESYSPHTLHIIDTDCPAEFVRRYVAAAREAFVVAMSDGQEWLWVAGGPGHLLNLYLSYDAENEPELVAEYWRTESERVLRAISKLEEAQRADSREEMIARRNPAHEFHHYQNIHNPPTPATDELLRRGLLDPTEGRKTA